MAQLSLSQGSNLQYYPVCGVFARAVLALRVRVSRRRRRRGARGGAPVILCGGGVSHGGSSTAAPQKIQCTHCKALGRVRAPSSHTRKVESNTGPFSSRDAVNGTRAAAASLTKQRFGKGKSRRCTLWDPRHTAHFVLDSLFPKPFRHLQLA